MNAKQLALGLGWFSVGLGLAELVAPRTLSRWLGMERRAGLVRAFGARELAAGIGVLSQPRRPRWLWARVAGDALDLAVLGAGLGGASGRRRNVALATGSVAGITALDVIGARRLSRRRRWSRIARLAA